MRSTLIENPDGDWDRAAAAELWSSHGIGLDLALIVGTERVTRPVSHLGGYACSLADRVEALRAEHESRIQTSE